MHSAAKRLPQKITPIAISGLLRQRSSCCVQRCPSPTKPLAQNNTPVTGSEENTLAPVSGESTPVYQIIMAESTPVPGEVTDLFLRYDQENLVPVSAAGEMVWTTENGRYYHLVENCSGQENSMQISRSEASSLNKQPCPVCIVFVTPIPEENAATVTPMSTLTPTPMPQEAVATPEPTEMPMDVVYDVSVTPEPIRVGAEVNAIISLNRYTTDDGCIMELEYAADAEFKFIDEPDTANWYVDEVVSAEYFFEEYLDHRLSDKNIELLKSVYEENGRAGYEVWDTLIMLNGVNTEFSADSNDVPSGTE